MTKTPVFLGIDLGSFKTSVACSNGCRCVFPTSVGWPKDIIAQRMFGKKVVIGEEIALHRRALRVVRPFEKGALKFVDHAQAGVAKELVDTHLTAARLIIQHAARDVRIGSGDVVYAAIGAPSQASIQNHQLILSAAGSEFTASLVVHEPFAVGYGMNKLDQTLIVDIGAGTIDICPMFGAYPDTSDQLTIPLGGDLIDEALLKGIKCRHPNASCSLEMARKIKEKFGSVHNRAGAIAVALAVDGTTESVDLTDVIREACSEFVMPITEGIWQVVSRLEPEYQRPLMDNILLAGGGSQLAGLDQQIEEGLKRFGGASVSRVYDSVFAGANGALKLAMDTPLHEWNRLTGRAKAA